MLKAFAGRVNSVVVLLSGNQSPDLLVAAGVKQVSFAPLADGACALRTWVVHHAGNRDRGSSAILAGVPQLLITAWARTSSITQRRFERLGVAKVYPAPAQIFLRAGRK
jgi:hypothetical protein